MAFIDKIEDKLNVSITENGAVGYDHTKSALVDFNFKIASYRDCNQDKIIADFKKAWYEDKELALKLLFYIRDVREGVGERRLFRIVIKEIADELDSRVIKWIEKYGRYDDLFSLFGTKLEDNVILFISNKLVMDMQASLANKPISLLAKWMPSVNTSSEESKKLAKYICKKANLTQQTYRKTLSTLRNYLKVTERYMCDNRWTEINYETVPSLANIRYKDAFMEHDPKGRQEYLKKLHKGEVKINSSVTFPHEIVYEYSKHGWTDPADETLEAMWKALPDYIQGKGNVLVVRDGSGSMTVPVSSKSGVTALDVADALSIYFSEHLSGPYKDKFITFSYKPEYVNLSNFETLRDKLRELSLNNDCSNTNLEAVFDLVLEVAVENKLNQEEIPTLLIISDMEFDNALTVMSNKFDKLFDVIKEKYKAEGYNLPKLVFWNVNSRTNTIPLTENKNGVILVSGFSAAISKMVLSTELDPYKALVDVLNSERYKEVTFKYED